MYVQKVWKNLYQFHLLYYDMQRTRCLAKAMQMGTTHRSHIWIVLPCLAGRNLIAD